MSRPQRSKALAFALALAVAATAALVMAVTPAVAADAVISPGEVAGKSLPSISSNRHIVRNRTALRHHVSPMQAEFGCAGTWCGRQFVLMVGIGY